MTSSTDNTDEVISSVLLELDAARSRLDQAEDWLAEAETTLAATALAEEVERLCRQAALSDDLDETQSMLARSVECLHKLQALLGTH